MAIVGLGTDIVDIERIESSLEKMGNSFAERILTPNEMRIFQSLKSQGRYLAKRFAAKEAAAKALGTGIAAGVSFQHFEILNDEMGKPHLTLTQRAQELAKKNGVAHYHISISDEQRYAMATVVLESA